MIGLKSRGLISRNPRLAQDSQAIVLNLPKRYYQLQRVHVYEKGGRNSYSGIQATMFGGTSPLGQVVGGSLTKMGS